ncbi:hypothetical protein TCAP_06710 [Tolypocladium capitatum]|uniref:Uncharacterized protein n=1 Tax=Tolypocladium capitatum TaxID=45235 RepID=A0A2K3Q723_9HYPO|nr:hypothetical protein TCAP_06710 [Tolypocladium capitatum]
MPKIPGDRPGWAGAERAQTAKAVAPFAAVPLAGGRIDWRPRQEVALAVHPIAAGVRQPFGLLMPQPRHTTGLFPPGAASRQTIAELAGTVSARLLWLPLTWIAPTTHAPASAPTCIIPLNHCRMAAPLGVAFSATANQRASD